MQIEKVKNPLIKHDGYHCFGCSKNNHKGLHLDFFRKDDRVFAFWDPDADLQGYFNVLHGGIQATMLDEMGAWWVYLIAGTAGFTSRLEVRYLKTVSVISGRIFLRASPIEKRRNLYTIRGELFNAEGVLCATARLEYFTFSEERAMAEMYYPGSAEFAGEFGDSASYGFPAFLFE